MNPLELLYTQWGTFFQIILSITKLYIFSADCIGFLYKITQSLSEMNLNIFFAKIATYGDGIVDSFYVLDENNNKIGKEMEEIIRNRLLLVIEELLDSELTSN